MAAAGSPMQTAGRPLLRLLRLSRFPIFHQLVLEEALLRATQQNWCLVNDGAFNPAIVMGISGKPEELIRVPEAMQAGIQVIKRFTGGGTVVVDEDTIFATLIMQSQDLPHVEPFPRNIMKWSESFYSPVFGLHGEFSLRENDYVFAHRKFGGNAQAITGRRWLHHTSFLWDFKPEAMALLQHPPRAPDYRAGRPHEDFVVRLKDHLPDRSAVSATISAAAGANGFEVQEVSLHEASAALAANKMCGTKLVDLASHWAEMQQQQQQQQAAFRQRVT